VKIQVKEHDFFSNTNRFHSAGAWTGPTLPAAAHSAKGTWRRHRQTS